jgi:hypothetical protein
MKDYNKLIQQILKNKDYIAESNSRKNTVKLKHIPSNNVYSIHPGDNAILPLKKWIKKIENNGTEN